MRHLKKVKKLGRDREHRKALLRNQVTSLFIHGKIKTTLQKAKETRRWAEKMITLGKNGTVAARREAFKFLADRKMVNRVFDEIAPLFKDRNGGYTRIYRLWRRRGDNAEMAMLELLEFPETKEKEEIQEEKKKKKRFLGLG